MNYTTPDQLTIIYYTSNWLDTVNPYFLRNTQKQLLKARTNPNTGAKLPVIIVSQKPTMFGTAEDREGMSNIVVGGIARSLLNL
jgi:hypothetical protein